MPRLPFPPQTLLIDADDTLWENHRYFLRVFDDFLEAAERRGHGRDHVAATVRAIESERTKVMGYGSVNYARSLVLALERLERAVPADERERWLEAGRW